MAEILSFLAFQDSQAAHIMRFIETEKCLNSAWKSGQRLSQVKELVHEELQRQLRGNPGALELAKYLHLYLINSTMY